MTEEMMLLNIVKKRLICIFGLVIREAMSQVIFSEFFGVDQHRRSMVS